MYSFEYLDRVEIIVAHMVGGVDASLKMSQGWPVSNHALKLISLKHSSQYSKEISPSFLCKVEMWRRRKRRKRLVVIIDSIEINQTTHLCGEIF
ncbi:unnamed protein product [Camellia sinensis]